MHLIEATRSMLGDCGVTGAGSGAHCTQYIEAKGRLWHTHYFASHGTQRKKNDGDVRFYGGRVSQ